ncbi:MAG: choice-of-anchor X domain-containing protein [Burkholderiaceae bacterium]
MSRRALWRKAVGVLAAVLAVCGLAFWLLAGEDDAARQQADAEQAASIASAKGVATPGAAGPFTAESAATRRQQLALWQQRYDRAAQLYTSYRDATRYPFDSRPLSEHPDQVRPFAPVLEDKALRNANGDPVRGVRLRTSQERVYVSAGESVKFTVEAVDDEGRRVPLVVSRSAAQSVPDTTALIAIVRAEVPFTDNGSGADLQAGDGQYSARLVPAQQGFASHNGTIRVLLDVSANGQQGAFAFDVIYTPSVPATWAGVREAQEGGSLNFYLKAQVQTAGRYVASARVFDANNKALALLQFNDEVRSGAAEFKLTLFGALVRDQNPAFPLRLVDVEGYLLRPDTFPDRALMPRLAGTVHVSRSYSPESFSSAEWDGEERQRYLAEYGKDVAEAQEQVRVLQGN